MQVIDGIHHKIVQNYLGVDIRVEFGGSFGLFHVGFLYVESYTSFARGRISLLFPIGSCRIELVQKAGGLLCQQLWLGEPGTTDQHTAYIE